MKKTVSAFIALALGAVSAAVWYCPFAGGSALYENNRKVGDVAFCYSQGDTVRYDFTGDECDMYAELDRIFARVVRVENADGVTVVYAYSDRVCDSEWFCDGKEYNVMAAYRDGHIAVGAPVLEGSY